MSRVSISRLGWLVVALAGVAVAPVYFLLNGMFSQAPARLSGGEEITVGVAPVRRGSAPVVIRLDGVLRPAREAQIVSRFSGKVREIRFKVGDSVPAGATVAVVDFDELVLRRREIEAALGAAQTEAEASEERAAFAERERDERREWHRRGLISRRELELAETAAETARVQVELARARLAQQEAMRAQLRALESLMRLTAPFAGVIVRKWVGRGAAVRPFEPVFTLADPQSLRFLATYTGPHAEEIHVGAEIEIASEAAPEKYRSRITQVEAGTDGLQIAAEVGNEQKHFHSGMAAQGLIRLVDAPVH